MTISDEFQSDFTADHYCLLLDMAKANYRFVSHKEALYANDRFIVWRHDVDLSLNRAVRLAEIEASKGISSTYFLNPHSDFYNLLEPDQHSKVGKIIQFGHSIGLHFDAKFYGVDSEKGLDQLVAREAGWLKEWFDAKISAFSFHNPNDFLLTCEKSHYGGLINCYSHKFKKQIPYCSDSNGYWRYRRLYEVLVSASDYCLQVLTHPGLWQERAMPARSRVFRCVHGREKNTLQSYDKTLADSKRLNYSGLSEAFASLKSLNPTRRQLYDHLWNIGALQVLFIDLSRELESQLVRFCRIWLRKALQAPISEINAVIASHELRLPPHRMFAAIYQKNWIDIGGVSEEEFLAWQQVRDCIALGIRSYTKEKLEKGIAFLVQVIQRLSQFREENVIPLIALNHTAKNNLSSSRIQAGACLKWVSENGAMIGLESKTWQKFIENYVAGVNSSPT